MNFLKTIFPDKETWCKNNSINFYIWMIKENLYTTKNMCNLNLQTIGDWIIINKNYKIKNKRVWNPSAVCWDSGENLFGKKATVIYCMIGNKPDKFYFKKSRYTAWILKQK